MLWESLKTFKNFNISLEICSSIYENIQTTISLYELMRFEKLSSIQSRQSVNWKGIVLFETAREVHILRGANHRTVNLISYLPLRSGCEI